MSLSVSLLTFLLDVVHAFDGLETHWRDLMAYLDRPAFRAPVTVVAIDDRDYADPELFGGVSPLHPATLERIVLRVAQHAPRGVIIDAQIHPGPEPTDRSRARLRLYQTLDSLSSFRALRWILIRDLEGERTTMQASTELREAWRRLLANRRLIWADAGLERRGHVVRELPRYRMEASGSWRPTVLGAAIAGFSLTQKTRAGFGTDTRKPYSPWPVRYSGELLADTSVVAPFRTSAGALLRSPMVVGQRSLLGDRVVLIGGTYYEGRDEHPTPLGEMPGVFVWAEALGSWLRNDAIREPPEWIVMVLDAGLGIVLGILLLRFGPGWNMVVNLLVVIVLAIVFSILTFNERSLFINFLAAPFSVALQYQAEIHIELLGLRRERRRHAKTIDRLKRRLAGLRSASGAPGRLGGDAASMDADR